MGLLPEVITVSRQPQFNHDSGVDHEIHQETYNSISADYIGTLRLVFFIDN